MSGISNLSLRDKVILVITTVLVASLAWFLSIKSIYPTAPTPVVEETRYIQETPESDVRAYTAPAPTSNVNNSITHPGGGKFRGMNIRVRDCGAND